MPKPLYLTEEMIQEELEEMRRKLPRMKLQDGKGSVEFSYYYPPSDASHPELDHARVSFTRIAWEKQEKLVAEFSSEIGWHGVCKRDPEDERHFIIEDIMVFPQSVTRATVTPSQEEYQLWNNTLPDEQFAHCRYHGHSHVSFGTSPSGLDNKVQEEILGRLDGDGYVGEARERYIRDLGDTYFYIFMIWNKKGEHHARIYDMNYNRFYSEKEVTVEHDADTAMDDFLQDAKRKVKTATVNTYGGKYYYGASPQTPAISAGAGKQPAASGEKQPASAKGKVADTEDHAAYPYGYDDIWDRWRQYQY